MTGTETYRGSRVVLVVYVAIVAIAGVMGYILGSIRPDGLDPELFFVVQLPPTPFGVALYGIVTIAVVLGVLLATVAFVSRRYAAESR